VVQIRAGTKGLNHIPRVAQAVAPQVKEKFQKKVEEMRKKRAAEVKAKTVVLPLKWAEKKHNKCQYVPVTYLSKEAINEKERQKKVTEEQGKKQKKQAAAGKEAPQQKIQEKTARGGKKNLQVTISDKLSLFSLSLLSRYLQTHLLI